MSESRATPFYCPYCGDEDLRPHEESARQLALRFLHQSLHAAPRGIGGTSMTLSPADLRRLRSSRCARDGGRLMTAVLCMGSKPVMPTLSSKVRPPRTCCAGERHLRQPLRDRPRPWATPCSPTGQPRAARHRPALRRHRLPLRRDDRDEGRGRGRLPGSCPRHPPGPHRRRAGPGVWAAAARSRSRPLLRARKVAPLDRALRNYDAWASGLRREESPTRATAPVVGWDHKRGKVKVNPLARWTQADVDAYIARHDVLVNPLLSDGYASIGCGPCTRRIAPGEDARAGRWAGTSKTECGING